jgi:hypothetical protein
MIHAPTPQQCRQIAMLNDQARRAMGVLCSVFESRGVRNIARHERQVIRALAETFTYPKHRDNPQDEHDFGVVYQLHTGAWANAVPSDTPWLRAVFWKFEYRDMTFFGPSPAPWDATQTRRLLNFMLPGEYGQDNLW